MSGLDELARFLREIPIVAVRLSLEVSEDQFEVPRLRGVWGAALHALDPRAYSVLFKPGDQGAVGMDEVPGYVVRPRLASNERAGERPGLELILIGSAVEHEESALRAWDMASGMGLGADRIPFPIVERSWVSPSGFSQGRSCPWKLDAVLDYLGPGDESLPLELGLVAPLSLQRDRRLIDQPSLVDIVGKTCRRMESFLPSELRQSWYAWRGSLIEDARRRPAIGRFERAQRTHRYSARQDRDLYIPGVVGALRLPHGAGPLLPILMALEWIHVGKGANLGLGRAAVRFGATEAPSS